MANKINDGDDDDDDDDDVLLEGHRFYSVFNKIIKNNSIQFLIAISVHAAFLFVVRDKKDSKF